MTEKIYEYKDEHDWFIGKWESFNYVTCFGDDAVYERVQGIVHQLLGQLGCEGAQVHIICYTSDLRLVKFLVDMINQEKGRRLEVTQHAGSILITENNQLLAVHLPKLGVSLEQFFGTNEGKGTLSFGDTILIATKNEGKTREFRAFFERLGYKVENLNDYPDLPDVAETGMTFEENARLKAETIANLTGKMVLADDSGLKVDKLGGMPGVWSARFSGSDATDDLNNAKLLHELAMVFDQKDRSAQFHCTLVVAVPEKESLVVEAEWPGYIAFAPQGEGGFGYDPLFLVGQSGQTAAQLSMEEKNQQSHRALALKKLMEAFPAWQAK
ncbi:nucleoside-triphosphate diphosphatase [Streptococcus sp. X16XC17]|uniref:nucleoside-triphosphate diphosphatase n=1 Tax=unclassified Streptococcus TaxID=2608887 RepID=UPI00066FCC61|nr:MULTISPECIES: nucleoside-triphosphate diphosphatase [unclassified Streptococcus]TCD46045.1 nucleoside-triphosphate diphosphatase [Streptococcus sp. X16XC17]